MILCIFGGGKQPSPTGCAEGLAPCLIGEFSALLAMRLGKFPNSYGIFSVNTLRRVGGLSVVALPAACLPV